MPHSPTRERRRSRPLAALVAGVGVVAGVLTAAPSPAGAAPPDQPGHRPPAPALPARAYADLPPADMSDPVAAAAVRAAAPEPLFPGAPPRWSTGGYRVTRPAIGSRPRTPDNYAVRVWQELLTEQGIRTGVDGAYGAQTARSVAAFQARRRLPATGTIDYPTARALLAATIKREARRVGMSADLLCGHLDLESGLDPRAVNPNGRDIGVAQINIGRWNPGVSVPEAFDEDFAIGYMARRDAGAYRSYRDWRIAVYDYNWPVDAQRWKRTGTPSARGKAYSDRVFRGCGGPDFPGNP